MEKSDRISQRNKKFQKSFTSEDLRKRRDQTAVKLRKQKRGEHISKKRAMPTLQGQQAKQADNSQYILLYFPIQAIPQQLLSVHPQLFDPSFSSQQRFDSLLSCISSQKNQEILYFLVYTLRIVISSQRIPQLSQVVHSEILDIFIQVVSESTQSPLKTECMWCLVNIASGPAEYGAVLVAKNTVQIIGKQILKQSPELADLMIWFLGNLAGDSVQTRDLILKSGAFHCILKFLKDFNQLKESQISTCIWVISNLLRGKPMPNREITLEAIKLVQLYINSTVEDIVYDCLWILTYVTDGDIQGIQDVIQTNIIDRLIQLSMTQNGKIEIPALRALGNLVTGNDTQTQHVLNFGIIQKLTGLLYSSQRAIKKQALWTFSNILAGTAEQVQMVIDSQAFQIIVQTLDQPDFQLKKEAVWALSNITNNKKSPGQCLKIVQTGAFEPLCRVLWQQDPRMLLVALDALNNLLRAGKDTPCQSKVFGSNNLVYKFEQIGGVNRLQELQQHPNPRVYTKVVQIMEEHYGIDEITDENADQINTGEFVIQQVSLDMVNPGFRPTAEKTRRLPIRVQETILPYYIRRTAIFMSCVFKSQLYNIPFQLELHKDLAY